MKTYKKFLLTGLLIGSLAGCSSTADNTPAEVEETPTVEDVEDAVDEIAEVENANGNINSGSLTGTIGEAVEATNGVTYTLAEVNYADVNGDGEMTPAEGNEFVYFKVVIENGSGEVYSVTPDEFRLLLPNATEEKVDEDAAAGLDDALGDSDLEDGAMVEGVLSFQAPADSPLTLAVYGHHLLDEEPLVTWTIER